MGNPFDIRNEILQKLIFLQDSDLQNLSRNMPAISNIVRQCDKIVSNTALSIEYDKFLRFITYTKISTHSGEIFAKEYDSYSYLFNEATSMIDTKKYSDLYRVKELLMPRQKGTSTFLLLLLQFLKIEMHMNVGIITINNNMKKILEEQLFLSNRLKHEDTIGSIFSANSKPDLIGRKFDLLLGDNIMHSKNKEDILAKIVKIGVPFFGINTLELEEK